MSPAALSIKRPIFISCILILITVLGWMSMKGMPLDLFPDVTEPTITIEAPYPGAGPAEVENQVSKKIEDELSTISGIKKISSSNKEGISVVTAQFNLGVNIDNAEQEVRAKIGNIRRELPSDMDEPVIRKVSTSDTPILRVSLVADLPDGALYDLADQFIRPQIEQIEQVGRVDILGGRKREIHVDLDADKLNDFYVTAAQVASALNQGGRNIPAGNVDQGQSQTSFRTAAEYPEINAIGEQLLKFSGNDRPLRVKDVATVVDALEDEKSRTFVSSKKALLLDIYRQTGANTVAVIEKVKIQMDKIQKQLEKRPQKPVLQVVMDRSKIIYDNVNDVKESIFIGILLTIVIVYFFLGSLRSTFITNLALPNSLLGAFIFMAWSGFSFNILSMLGLSVVIGLLIDDAIVVRENIYRHIEHGRDSTRAAYWGTVEVMLPVISTTFAVLSVFGPIGNLKGVVGQYFKQFGLSICFAMAVSLFDALTIAPMLSAYFAGNPHRTPGKNIFSRFNHAMLSGFNNFQTWLENIYEKTLRKSLRFPVLALILGVLIFVLSLWVAKKIPATFIPPQDNGEFSVSFDLPLGSGFDATEEVGRRVEAIVQKEPTFDYDVMTIGSREGEAQKGDIYVRLVGAKQRAVSTTQVKERLREQLSEFVKYNVKVADVSLAGTSERQFNVNISGADQNEVEDFSKKVYERLKNHPDLVDVDSSNRAGKPEFLVHSKQDVANLSGVTLTGLGQELRVRVEGTTPAIFSENSVDYDVRVRMRPEQRNLKEQFHKIMVSNTGTHIIPLAKLAYLQPNQAPSEILRENRSKYIRISADLNAKGNGLGGAMKDTAKIIEEEFKIPSTLSYSFPGQGEQFAELVGNMLTALGLGLLLIYLVLSSLYESFMKPFTILLVLPLAACGAFVALYLTHSYLDLFSMIGCVLLMGLATKNSILLIDQVSQLEHEGHTLKEALIEAGRLRLRPIIMTSVAMIGGMLPVAIGLNEASRSRTGLGIVVIGGVISSTLLTLYIIPSVYYYMEAFEKWFFRLFNRFVRAEVKETDPRPQDVIDDIVREPAPRL